MTLSKSDLRRLTLEQTGSIMDAMRELNQTLPKFSVPPKSDPIDVNSDKQTTRRKHALSPDSPSRTFRGKKNAPDQMRSQR